MTIPIQSGLLSIGEEIIAAVVPTWGLILRLRILQARSLERVEGFIEKDISLILILCLILIMVLDFWSIIIFDHFENLVILVIILRMRP